MKLKRKKAKTSALALDFVTALTLAECEERLSLWSTPPGRNVEASLDQRVISERVRVPLYLRSDRGGGYYTVAQTMILRPVQNGTHVLGRLHPSTRRRLRLERWVWSVVVVLAVGFTLLGLVQNGPSSEDAWSGFLVVLMLTAWGYFRYTALRNTARHRVWQIRDMLYEPPGDQAGAGR